METIIEEITNDVIKDRQIYEKAADILQKGGLVAFPTETVYGLGADALDTCASAKIYAAKGRPSDNPLIVHIADIKDLYELAFVNENALKLADKFWPGPLTLILRKKEVVPDSITGGLDTVAVRMPSHPVASELIKKSGVYIAAPSANISGKPSPTKGEHVIHDMNGRVDMIIVSDTVDIGVESTIVDVSEEIPTILRPGYITLKNLSEVVGEVRTDPAIMGSVKDGVVPKAPGMKYKHYAPDAELAIVEGSSDAVVKKINELTRQKEEEGFSVGIIATEEMKNLYNCKNIKVVGSREDEKSIAHNLFAILREFDKEDVQFIYSEGFSTDNVGQAVMNRLIKAAGHTIIKA
jgi:L-threonylcarbamoyladenylate synthase